MFCASDVKKYGHKKIRMRKPRNPDLRIPAARLGDKLFRGELPRYQKKDACRPCNRIYADTPLVDPMIIKQKKRNFNFFGGIFPHFFEGQLRAPPKLTHCPQRGPPEKQAESRDTVSGRNRFAVSSRGGAPALIQSLTAFSASPSGRPSHTGGPLKGETK